MNWYKRALFLLPLLAPLCIAAAPSSDSVLIDGDGIQQTNLSLANLQQKEMEQISFEMRGEKHTATATSLLALLQKIGLQTKVQMGQAHDARQKNAFLHLAILVIGRDGYATVFGLPDLMPNFGNQQAYIAWDMDGKPLDDRHGPAELIIPNDSKPERWVRGIVEIKLIDVDPAPSTQPTAAQ
jgi:DMSO/TMAO reductase YedYZ molybdopterin-dependent catalytic subunit